MVQDNKLDLVGIGSRIWAFDCYRNRWPWMTLNGVPLYCDISPNLVAFRAHYI